MRSGATTAGERRDPARLWPREHGAYGQIALPVVAMLAMAPSWAGLAFTVAASACFLAHEPILVLIGHRGRRAREVHGGAAAERLRDLAAIAAAGGMTGALLSPLGAAASLVPVALGLGVAWLVARKRERSLDGELLVGAALAFASLPVALAGGVRAGAAVAFALGWSLAFGAATAAVRVVLSSHKGRLERGSLSALGATSVAAIALSLTSPSVVMLAPVFVVSWVVTAARPHPRRLRTIGWTLVSAMLIGAVATVLAARS